MNLFGSIFFGNDVVAAVDGSAPNREALQRLTLLLSQKHAISSGKGNQIGPWDIARINEQWPPRFHGTLMNAWEAPIPQFFFDYFDGKQLHPDPEGLAMPDADTAYLEAFKAAIDMWGEALAQRRNPSFDCFVIRDSTGATVLELPFAEVLESTRGGGTKPPPGGPATPIPEPADNLDQRLSRAREVVEEQRRRVEGLKAKGRDAKKAEELLRLLTHSLSILEGASKVLLRNRKP